MLLNNKIIIIILTTQKNSLKNIKQIKTLFN